MCAHSLTRQGVIVVPAEEDDCSHIGLAGEGDWQVADMLAAEASLDSGSLSVAALHLDQLRLGSSCYYFSVVIRRVRSAIAAVV